MKSNEPQTVDKLTWYYENKRSISVIREIRDIDGTYHRTEVFNIPIKMLQKSIKRINKHDKS
jgi:hypothetical protein